MAGLFGGGQRAKPPPLPDLPTSAAVGALSLRNAVMVRLDPPDPSPERAWAVAAESLALILHVIDRHAFAAAGAVARQQLLDSITPKAIWLMIEFDWATKSKRYRESAYEWTLKLIGNANQEFSEFRYLLGDEHKSFNPMTLDHALGRSGKRIFAILERDSDFWIFQAYALSMAEILTKYDLFTRATDEARRY